MDLLWVILTDDALMTEVNRETFGKDAVTDVITRRFDAVPSDPDGPTAEIFVNVAEARRRGRSRRATCSELALYLAHGCDHLGGADDATPAQRRSMRRRERRWLASPAVRAIVTQLLGAAGRRPAPKAQRRDRRQEAPR